MGRRGYLLEGHLLLGLGFVGHLGHGYEGIAAGLAEGGQQGGHLGRVVQGVDAQRVAGGIRELALGLQLELGMDHLPLLVIFLECSSGGQGEHVSCAAVTSSQAAAM